jgi:release factor glutamine methyltransferase
MPCLKELLFEAQARLKAAKIEDALLNVNLMAASLFGCDQAKLPLLWPEPVEERFKTDLAALVARRCRHEPLQYILGEWSFLDFQVKTRPGALIPRPETEELVLEVFNCLAREFTDRDFSFVDLCSGSGIIGIALAKKYPASRGWLCDISARALQIAAENLKLNNLDCTRLRLLRADMLSSFAAQTIDLIVANPPYIKTEELSQLMPEVRSYEPAMALDGGPDGLKLIDKMLRQANECLKSGGILAFEHGHGQRQQIMHLLEKMTCFSLIDARDDLCRRERIFILQKR